MLYGMEDCGDIEGSITDGTFETGDNGCEYGPGSTYMTIACVCYLGCGVLLCWYARWFWQGLLTSQR